ncbi:MAG: acyl carrier protein [Rhizobiaceae bacterium]|nr:acyl carrier protein [Rhizobiaceae bacterium]
MKLYDIIAGILNVEADTLSEKSNAMNTPNWDSLRHIEVILAVETAYNIRFAINEVVNMQNLGDMRTVLEAKNVSFDETEPVRLSA